MKKPRETTSPKQARAIFARTRKIGGKTLDDAASAFLQRYYDCRSINGNSDSFLRLKRLAEGRELDREGKRWRRVFLKINGASELDTWHSMDFTEPAVSAPQPVQIAKATAGEWSTQDTRNGFTIFVEDGSEDGKLIAQVENVSPANRALLVASPTMLGALRRLAKAFEINGDGIFRGIADDVRAAIAKAEGR